MADPSSTRLAVLIVDDAVAFAKGLCNLFSESEDFEVVGPAHDGQTALALFQRFEPHAMLLDLQLPDMSGIEVLRQLRKLKNDCYIVALTLSEEESLRDAVLAAGANHFVNKCENLDSLVGKLRSALRK